MELWKRCRIGLLLLAMLCLVTGCSPIDWKTAADTITEQASKETKKPEEVESISTEAYAYQTLDEKTKKVYDEVLDAILKNKESVAVSTCYFVLIPFDQTKENYERPAPFLPHIIHA